MSTNRVTKRDPISLAIKNSIWSYHKNNDKLKVSDMVLWAEEKYGIPFLPATMRTILFPKPNKFPFETTFSRPSEDRQRDRPPNWPELENELAKWYTSLPSPPKGQDLMGKAKELWQKLAPKHYVGQEQPKFGDSWRDKFKERHGFKQKRLQAKGPVANINASIAVQEIDDAVDMDDLMKVDNDVENPWILSSSSEYHIFLLPHPNRWTLI